ncbi:MAG: hypothetical protein WA814_10175 [Candidatus Baltobacteraceae bacterium]
MKQITLQRRGEPDLASSEGPCLGKLVFFWLLYAYGMVMLWQWLSRSGWPGTGIWAVAILAGIAVWQAAREL